MTDSNSKSSWVDYVIFGLSIFLVFCLIFESRIELPSLVGWLGRWHPLILHFPIVFIIITVFLGFTKMTFPKLLLEIMVISVLVTAISGFFLGKEAGEKGDLLFWHQWLGAGLAFLLVIFYQVERRLFGKAIVKKAFLVVMLVLVSLTGHYGGMVTHGEDYLALPTSKNSKKLPENPLIYAHVVAPILEDKCVSCHNPNKQKGALLMHNLEGLFKGGEHGNTLVSGNPDESELIKRLHLPLEEEEHMPPEGKTQLDSDEIAILERWIALGASDTLKYASLSPTEPLQSLVKNLMEPSAGDRWKELPIVADSTLQNLASDYLTITRMAGNSNALSIDVYLPPEYDSKPILDLERIAVNIVEFDLSGIPIGAEEVNLLTKCANLEWLELDKTPITNQDLGQLKSLTNLTLLKLYETSVTDESISTLLAFQNLKRLYIWGTKISSEGLEELTNQKPSVKIDNGMDNEIKDFFVSKDTLSAKEK
ncbi:c-type cytochrome domain-containing protein [Euzebyella saccharophila]|uniref:C-type cytochrome domain-containing protein n=1 Tax=Euzebyella saccharophila TaxID=679664 RepID=A0ABV8JL10_9FLAO|nr:c-type cytochrome domain-containing protein [Euzebyella saccharophila]